MYTLKDEDYTWKGVTYPSLRLIYLSLSDPTEYRIANEYLGGWPHWKKLCRCGWFREHLDSWREELEVSIRSQALQAIRDKAQDEEHKDHYNASKFLLERGWEPKAKPKAGPGRTTKQKIKDEANALFKDKDSVNEDFKRLMN